LSSIVSLLTKSEIFAACKTARSWLTSTPLCLPFEDRNRRKALTEGILAALTADSQKINEKVA
jgi:hypothetical protein